MSRPNSKSQLLAQIPQEHDALTAFVQKLTLEQLSDLAVMGDWSVKDVLAHLTAWEQMFLDWYRTGKRGEKPVVPAAGYTWKQIPALNQHIYEQYRDNPVEEILARFYESYTDVMDAITQMTDDELFTLGVYTWIKTTTLGSYAVSATCSHYAWALKEIRRGIKQAAGESIPS